MICLLEVLVTISLP